MKSQADDAGHHSSNEDEERIRRKAYELWLSEGRPSGREQQHWDMARELVAIEDSSATMRRSPPRTPGEPVEPVEAFQNQGEMPGLTDQGESLPGPTREAESENATKRPLSPPSEHRPSKAQTRTPR